MSELSTILIYLIFIVLMAILFFLQDSMANITKRLEKVGITLSDNQKKRLKALKKKEVNLFVLASSIELLTEYGAKVDMEAILLSYENGQDGCSILHAQELLDLYVRDFSFEYLQAVELSGVGAQTLADLFENPDQQQENIKKVTALSPTTDLEKSITTFFLATAMMFQKKYEASRPLFEKSLTLQEIPEVRFCYAESYFWENEEHLTVAVAKQIFATLHQNSSHYIRMVDIISSKLEVDYDILEEFTLSEEHKTLCAFLLEKIELVKEDILEAKDDINLYILSYVYHLNGNFAEAHRIIELCLELEPGDEEYQKIAQILSKKMHSTDAC